MFAVMLVNATEADIMIPTQTALVWVRLLVARQEGRLDRHIDAL